MAPAKDDTHNTLGFKIFKLVRATLKLHGSAQDDTRNVLELIVFKMLRVRIAWPLQRMTRIIPFVS